MDKQNLQTCKYGTGLCSLSSIRVSQGEELINVVRLEEASLFGIFQNTIGQKLFEDLPDLQQIKNRIRPVCNLLFYPSRQPRTPVTTE